MAPRTETVAEDWRCNKCWGVTPKTNNAPYVNFGSRKSCNSCGMRKGECFLDKVKGNGKGNGKGGNGNSTAEHAALVRANKELQDQLDTLRGADAEAPDDQKPATDPTSVQLQAKIKRLEPSANALGLLQPGDAGYESRLTVEAELKAVRQQLLELKPPGARLAAAKGNLKKKETAYDKTKASRSACEKVVAEAQAELEKALAAEAVAAEAVAAANKELATAQEANSPAAPPKADEQRKPLPIQARLAALAKQTAELAEEGKNDPNFAQQMHDALLPSAIRVPPNAQHPAPATPLGLPESEAEAMDDEEEEDMEDVLDSLAVPGESDDRRVQRRQDLEQARAVKKEQRKGGKVVQKQFKPK